MVIKAVLDDPIDLDSGPGRFISAIAKDFLRRLLCKNPTDRFSAQQALKHPWITETINIPFAEIKKAWSALGCLPLAPADRMNNSFDEYKLDEEVDSQDKTSARIKSPIKPLKAFSRMVTQSTTELETPADRVPEERSYLETAGSRHKSSISLESDNETADSNSREIMAKLQIFIATTSFNSEILEFLRISGSSVASLQSIKKDSCKSAGLRNSKWFHPKFNAYAL
jgi:serine/threonine protein kinase